MLPEDLLDGRFKLITPPELYLRLDELVASPHATAREIGELIAQDPALAARLLRIANSPLHGLTTPVETIDRAITVIGLGELLDLVVSASITSALAQFKVGDFDLEAFWRHSVQTAITSRLLGRHLHLPDCERLFVAGLLHDIGLLFLAQRFPGKAGEWMDDSGNHGTDLNRFEDENLGFDHGQLAVAMLKHWRLSGELLDTVGRHHDGHLDDLDIPAAIIQIADRACGGDEAAIPDCLRTRTGLSADTIRETHAKAAAQTAEVTASLLP